MEAAYPREALKEGVTGRSEIECSVQPDGRLQACVVLSETPAGKGFGEASLALADKFRVSPETVKADASGVKKVRIPMRWGIASPQWIRTPNGDDFAANYPVRALENGVNGHAVIRCRVAEDGTLTRCVVIAETPLGWGFGEATLRLAPHFRMKTESADGQPVYGGIVIIPVTWLLSDGSTRHPSAEHARVASGELGFVLTVAENPKPSDKVVPCPSEAQPDRRCHAHTVSWLESPSAAELREVFATHRGLDGLSQLYCSVSSEGALQNCAAAEGATPAQADAMKVLSSRLKPQTETNDGVRVYGAEIIIVFKWPELALESRSH